MQDPTKQLIAFNHLHKQAGSISLLELWAGFCSQIALNLADPVHVHCVCPFMG